MKEKEYIIFCDESVAKGEYYSNFYGGVIVAASSYNQINATLNAKKQELNLKDEVKWGKVTSPYLKKYEDLMETFFKLVDKGQIRIRIFFRQNANKASDLTEEQLNGTYFRLYYQFIKHAFGLMHAPDNVGTNLRIYFDEFPITGEAVAQFKGFIKALDQNPDIKTRGFKIDLQDITEVRSHQHVLGQCLDVVLGSMAFRLNELHKEKPKGAKRRGKRTVAKEQLYKTILEKIRSKRPGFNIGVSTGIKAPSEKWTAPYLHWNFVPKESNFHREHTKKFKQKSPIRPT